MSREFDMHDAEALPPVPDDRLLSEGAVLSGRVVCHHPFDAPAGRGGRWTAPAPAADAVNTLVSRGADVFLTGHLHVTYVGHTATRYPVGGRSGIGVEVMSLQAACRTYNILVAEERKVAAALLFR